LVAPRFAELKKTLKMKKIDQRIRAGKLPLEAPIYAELLSRLVGA
jgi:hypothetical protein